jgi:hypothetical protein
MAVIVTLCSAGLCTICGALCVLQACVHVVGRFVFCGFVYRLWGTLCFAGFYKRCVTLCVLRACVQVVGHFVFCRLL